MKEMGNIVSLGNNTTPEKIHRFSYNSAKCGLQHVLSTGSSLHGQTTVLPCFSPKIREFAWSTQVVQTVWSYEEVRPTNERSQGFSLV